MGEGSQHPPRQRLCVLCRVRACELTFHCVFCAACVRVISPLFSLMRWEEKRRNLRRRSRRNARFPRMRRRMSLMKAIACSFLEVEVQ